MNLHEYRTKQILLKYGIPVPPFYVASSLAEVDELIKKHALSEAVVKVQIHAGGRGKAGGVKKANNPSEIRKLAKELIGLKIINSQTGPSGMIAEKILLTTPLEIDKEYYLAIVLDRQIGSAVIIASPSGGMDIEEVAKKTPGNVLRLPIPLKIGLQSFHLVRIAKFMGWKDALAKEGKAIISALMKAFFETDATFIEINPLALDVDQKLWALDAKLAVDDNALFRRPEIERFFDPSQLSPNEVLASKCGLAYVGLDGDIGCMVNGAGLAMATMDLIYRSGGRPANFLDVGGGASQEKIGEGFKIILSDPSVKAIIINIFGGIMNCETLARGIISAANEFEVNVPLVIRLEGTRAEEGKKLLRESRIRATIAESLTDAAEQVMEAMKNGK